VKFSIYQTSRQGGRRYNQDRVAYAYSREALLMVVADGMGGHFHGEVAAQIAVQLISEMFRNQADPLLKDAQAFLKAAMHQAHEAIYHYAKENKLPDYPRTTCVACVVQKHTACWAHVGDSRLYLFRRGQLVARTRDHSRVQQLFDSGRISEAQMNTHPERNKIYNCLGGEIAPEVELTSCVAMKDGDTLLLCTDGLWSMLSVNELGSILDAYPINRAVDELMDHAELRAGEGGDNLSAVGVTWGDPHKAGEQAFSTAAMPLDQVTTRLGSFQESRKADEALQITDEDIERAIQEIQAAIKKYSK
jgi:serine/threonine protein phosphatase PrpC